MALLFCIHEPGDFHTKTVIVATGGGAFTPRKLAVDYDPPALEGQQLLFCSRSRNLS